ncbi:MAG: Uma2 family endonuclease [Candidatus Magnetominusculus sp. LBB02]|nr:Uma2 family endonuclease [Candidatus Magnetominusculus sp. LBB02]
METLTIERDIDLTEIINGEEVVSPSPFSRHQDIVGNLYDIMRRHVKTNKLGKVHISPLDVILEEGINRLQPDILFIRKENMAIDQDWIRGVPDMVCEVVSSSSYDYDTGVKKAIYEKYGVSEYWIVMPELKTIEIFTLDAAKYKLLTVTAFEGVVASKVIEGLEVNIEEVFED